MKRTICLLTLFLAVSAYGAGGVLVLSLIGPTRTASSPVTIAAGGAGVKNCLTNLDVVSDADYTLRILDGSTTAYTLVASSGAVVVRSWDEDHAFCGANNAAMYITVNAGNPNINHMGYTR